VSQATRAARGLERRGEAYTAVRVLTDLQPVLNGDLRAPLAEHAAARPDAMGAMRSANEATAAADPTAP
jgi:hypothetical protein